jgi:glycosyltransferase involved in cell wall biosynthesis
MAMTATPKRPRHIALVSAEYPPETAAGGIGTYAATLAPALLAAGCRVTVVSKAVDAVDSVVEREGVRVIRLADVEPPAGFWHEPFTVQGAAAAKQYYTRAYTVAVAFMTLPELADVDFIEVPDWGGEGALLKAARPEIPYVVRFHTPARMVFEWNRAGAGQSFVDGLHALEAVAVANATGWSSPSRWLAQPCARLFGLTPSSIAAQPNPFDWERFAMAGAQRTQDIVSVGRVEARKGVIEGLAAIIPVLEARREARWRLIGADTNSAPGGGSLTAWLRQRMPTHLRERLLVDGNVPREELPRVLAEAAVVFLPSRNENFPYVCLEAMAAQAPIVASCHGGMAEMIEEGRSGLLIDPSDTTATSTALLRILMQPGVANALASGARRAVARFAPEKVVPEILRHFAEVSTRHTALAESCA